MSSQAELFHEDWRDALRHLIKALGGYEAAGADLFPHKTRKAAGSWLSDCLNLERPAKLELEEIESLLRMGRSIGCHLGVQFLCDATGYTKPTTVEPKDTLAEVERQMDQHVSRIEKLLQQYERARAADMVLSCLGRRVSLWNWPAFWGVQMLTFSVISVRPVPSAESRVHIQFEDCEVID